VPLPQKEPSNQFDKVLQGQNSYGSVVDSEVPEERSPANAARILADSKVPGEDVGALPPSPPNSAVKVESSQQGDNAADMTIDEIEKQMMASIAPEVNEAGEGAVQVTSSDGLPGGAEVDPRAKGIGTGTIGDNLDADRAALQDHTGTSLKSDGGQEERSVLHQGDSEKEADQGVKPDNAKPEHPPVEPVSPVLVEELQELERSLIEQIGGATESESDQQDKQVADSEKQIAQRTADTGLDAEKPLRTGQENTAEPRARDKESIDSFSPE
jgi:hypothetical protein